MAETVVRLYRPSNGTAGEGFIATFCDRCERDEAFRNGTGDSCPIVAATMAYDVDHPKYPREWQYVGEEPTCTAFIPLGATLCTPRCTKTPDMFGEPT